MKFDDAASVDQICYEMRLADWPRSLDRQRINDLFNGVPPYSEEERERNGIAINVNFLEGTRLAHDARMQFAGNFLKPGKYFTARTDMGPTHKRNPRSTFVTHQLAKLMKRSSVYYETFRSQFALDVLHGIGPSCWDTPDHWCPDGIGVEDVLVPANTVLHMKNLPLFTLYHSYTGPELIRLTRNRDIAKETGWNLPLVDKCIAWLDEETMALSHNNWPETWSPEKMGERVKSDGGFYAADSVPTIDCFDFYFWNDDQDEEGWCRRIVLDSWSTPQSAGGVWMMQRDSKRDFGRNQFLFNSKQRKVASSWRNIVTWQFADLSAVAPFHYHSVRSLGLLLYAVCNLQNRMRCRFNECVWESTLMYLRVKSQEDIQRALKVELVNRGFIDESISFVPAAERFQVNDRLLQEGLMQNQQLIQQNTASYTQSFGQFRDRTEKTKFQVMAEIQSMTAMISAALQQAYRYQEFQYREIFRRFCLKDSRDPDVQLFRGACLRYGIPESMLTPEAWDIEPERVLGAGNKTLEMAIAEQLMQYRNLYDPEPQREILRDVTLAITDDPARAEALVPTRPMKITDSVHDAEISTASLMMGLPVDIKTGMNHIEYVDTMLRNLSIVILKAKKQGNMASPDQIEGMQNMANHINAHIQIVAQDENEKQRVTFWQKNLTKMMNEVKGFMQRLQQAMKDKSQQGNGADPEAMAKIQSQKMQAEAKMANTRESHAQRTAQRQIQFEMEEKRDQQRHAREMQMQSQKAALELRAKQAETAAELRGKRAERVQELGARRLEQAAELVHEDRKSRMQTKKKKESDA